MPSIPKPLEIVEFSVLMAREFPAARPHELVALMTYSKRHAGLMERDCNTGDVSDKTVQTARTRITALCAAIDPKCVPVFSDDPRGATVKLTVPSGKTNDWGAVGICVPGS